MKRIVTYPLSGANVHEKINGSGILYFCSKSAYPVGKLVKMDNATITIEHQTDKQAQLMAHIPRAKK